ncbi:MAG: hypothetical protein RBT49_06375 [Bacteroidales bacterium]|jgi:hypothetical protein|nr:hypothetical protein [Bacteroidales bacterium]
MKLINGVVYLEDSVSFYPNNKEISYVDVSGNKIVVPMSLIVRLYEGSKYHYEKNCAGDWDKFCDQLFKNP